MRKNIFTKLLMLMLVLSLALTFTACAGPVSEIPHMPEETEDPQDTENPARPDDDAAINEVIHGAYLSHPFTANDLYGNTVTEKSLGEKELYFIHFWGTWCPPCVTEMPDLAEIAKIYGDRVGFLGLLDDFSNTEGALRIIEQSGIPESFINIDAHLSDVLPLLDMCRTGYVPTTVIVDASGQMLMEPLIGAYGMGYADVLDALLG